MTAPAILARPHVRTYACRACKAPHPLAALNDDMLCADCGEPEPDPEDCDPTADELFRTECTWSV